MKVELTMLIAIVVLILLVIIALCFMTRDQKKISDKATKPEAKGFNEKDVLDSFKEAKG
ncbi:MAG: hypothetical protein OEY59_11685 [Deltaproteobacteria bacterium]|nr:hypothetical protein [Deltaproteobacteria bacterium]